MNVHLKATPKDFPDMKLDTRAPHDVQQVAEWLIKEVARLTGHFGKRVIAENLIYRGHTLGHPAPRRAARSGERRRRRDRLRPAPRPVARPHRRRTTWQSKVPALSCGDYLEALPLHRLTELHLTGILFFEERVRDHFGFTGSDWKVITRAFEHIRTGRWATPETVAFEYGGIGEVFEWRSEKAVLEKDLTGLRKLVDSAEK